MESMTSGQEGMEFQAPWGVGWGMVLKRLSSFLRVRSRRRRLQGPLTVAISSARLSSQKL